MHFPSIHVFSFQLVTNGFPYTVLPRHIKKKYFSLIFKQYDVIPISAFNFYQKYVCLPVDRYDLIETVTRGRPNLHLRKLISEMPLKSKVYTL